MRTVMTQQSTVYSLKIPRQQAGARHLWLTPCTVAEPPGAPPAADHSDRWPAQLIDISLGGMNLLVTRDLDVGTLLQLEIENPVQEVSRFLLARVMHSADQA